MSYPNIGGESKFKVNKNQLNPPGTLHQTTDGVASASSLMWTPEDDMGNKMQAKLAAGGGQQERNLVEHLQKETTALNTQKLKDITRQKKQMQ